MLGPRWLKFLGLRIVPEWKLFQIWMWSACRGRRNTCRIGVDVYTLMEEVLGIASNRTSWLQLKYLAYDLLFSLVGCNGNCRILALRPFTLSRGIRFPCQFCCPTWGSMDAVVVLVVVRSYILFASRLQEDLYNCPFVHLSTAPHCIVV